MAKRRKGSEDVVSASELSSFAYCPEQWRLEFGEGLPATNRVERILGTRHHERKAIAERIAGGSITLGRNVAMTAFLVIFLIIWSWW